MHSNNILISKLLFRRRRSESIRQKNSAVYLLLILISESYIDHAMEARKLFKERIFKIREMIPNFIQTGSKDLRRCDRRQSAYFPGLFIYKQIYDKVAALIVLSQQ